MCIRDSLEIARNELAQQDKFTLRLVNDEVDACAARLYDVICQRAGLTLSLIHIYARASVVAAFELLSTKRAARLPKKHGNMAL